MNVALNYITNPDEMDSFQYPLEGYKCLYKIIALNILFRIFDHSVSQSRFNSEFILKKKSFYDKMDL
jgi:hypothetical protein